MGQSSSTQRDHRRISLSDHFATFRTERGRGNRDDAMNYEHNIERSGETGPPLGSEILNDNLPTSPSLQLGTATELSDQSTLLPDGPTDARDPQNTRESDGPDFGINQQGNRSATFARMAARRQSTMSRLGSRILPNSVIRGLLSSEEETPAEGHAHRHGVSRSIPRTEAVHTSSRFSTFNPLGSRGINRRRSVRAPYFIPRSDSALTADTTAHPVHLHPDSDRTAEMGRSSWRRSARLHRVRRSLSNPISQMFGQQNSSMPSTNIENSRPPSQSDLGDQLYPAPTEFDSRMDFDEPHELDSVEPAVHNTRPASPVSDHSTQGTTPGTPQLPGFLRARPSRGLRREDQTSLTRVLQLAAAAIAAQLSGTTGPVLPNIQALDNDGADGSLENFIQSLQSTTSAQTNPASNDAQNPNGENGPPPPVNFLRVFRFAGNANRPGTESGNTGQADGMDADNQTEPPAPEGRIVTLVAVGVRSVPSGNSPGGNQPNRGNGLDALLRLPYLSPRMRNPDGAPGLPPRTDGPSRLFPSRHSLGPSGLSANNEQIQHPGPSNTPHRFSDVGDGSPFSSLPGSLPGSPPSPHPPPSTPAEPGLSTAPSGASTPSRRPSSASAMPQNILPQVHENHPMQPTVEPTDDQVPSSTARQRRRSDSEYARHRDFGSGSVRRNGIVEPDNASPPAGRSWLIYVVGTNVSENHPAITTPSLFTDVSSPEAVFKISSNLDFN